MEITFIGNRFVADSSAQTGAVTPVIFSALINPSSSRIIAKLTRVRFSSKQSTLVEFGRAAEGASWASVDSASVMEYDTAATALSGGSVLLTCFSDAKSEHYDTELPIAHPFSLDAFGTTSDIVTLASININSATSNVLGSLTWKEIY